MLVVVDTLRVDRLGSYGAEPSRTPALDALAAQSVRFERAYATAPWTMPSVGSILTGLHPHRFRNSKRPFAALPERVVTLAERFAEAGYSTGSVVSHFLLGRQFRFDQGFQVLSEDEAQGHDYVSTRGVTDFALTLVDRFLEIGRPFFLFVHYFDPHYEYVRHPELGTAPARAGRLEGGVSIEDLREMLGSLSEEELTWLRQVYDGEVRFTDAGVGRLLDGLRARDLDDATVVAFTADHGEELAERGWLGHTRTLYDELVRVPLLLRAPGLTPRTISTPVSLVALAPTLLELAGVEVEGRSFDGASWAAALASGFGPDPVPLLLEVDFRASAPHDRVKNARKRGIVWQGHKLVHDLQTGEVSLFDLESDPNERSDLAASRPDRRRALERILTDSRRAAQPAAGSPAAIDDLDPASRERLRRLGYLAE